MTRIIMLLTIVIFLCLESCELAPREISLAEHDSKIAITALLTSGDTTNNILFNVSIGILDSTQQYENGFLNNQTLTLHTPDAGPVQGYIAKDIDDYKPWERASRYRQWKFDYNEFIIGETYELEATADNYEAVSAKTTVPQPPNVLDVKVTKDLNPRGMAVTRDKFEITLKDDPSVRNYYRINGIPISSEEIPFYNPYRFYRNASDPLDFSALDELIIVLSDDEFNGQEYTIILYGEIINEQPYNQVDISLVSITEQEYRRTLALNSNIDNNPFAEPIIYNSNIANGYGVFSISSSPFREAITVE